MKKKLKQLRLDVAAAKTAWQEARKAKKPAEEIARLAKAYWAIRAVMEEAEADGKADDDEIEVPSDSQQQPPPGGGQAGQRGAEGDGAVVELAEFKRMLNDTMTEQLEARFKALGVALTPEKMTEIIDAAIKKHNADSKLPDEAMLKRIGAEVAEQAFLNAKKPSKMKHNENDGSRVEFGGYSLAKGNLPLHMKQLVNRLLGKDQNEGVPADMLAKGAELENTFWQSDVKRVASMGIKALTTTGDGTGSEWIPRTLSAELYRRMYLESQLANEFLAQQVDMPTDPYDYPLLTTDPTFYLNNVENREGQVSNLGTAKTTLTTQTLMARCQFSYKADEDSIIPLLPTIQQTLARAAARALETALINGDTTGTHQDSDINLVLNHAAKAWKGFRKLALAASLKVDLSTGGLSRANLLAVLKKLEKWGVRTQDILWVPGSLGWNALLNLDEVALAYARGAAGTYIAGGPPPAPWGGRIVVSEQARENLNASGVYDGSTTTKGSILAINKSGFIMGSRRDFLLEVDRNIFSQTHDVVASFRKAFQPVETPAAGTAATVALGYNYNA